MAIFERARPDRLELDDTHLLSCVIETSHNSDGHTEYSIKCTRGFDRKNVWWVSRRYSEFAALNSTLQIANVPLPFPRKKIIGNMNPNFVAQRRNDLQIYLDAVLKNNLLRSSLIVKMFLDPKNYSFALNENALQNVSMALRGDGNYELKTALPAIGWRIRKHYYAVSKVDFPDEKYIMTWQTYGPDKVLCERDTKAAFKCLMNLEHPYIDKLISIQNLESGTYVIKKIYPNGSLKDHIYGTQYKDTYATKYSNPKQSKPFTIGQIAYYGYQILQALKFLHERGWPYGHLHTGNIAVENQKIVLMDIENSILGVPSKIRHFLCRHKKIFNLESIDVYSFGHVLYEMTYGQELSEPTCELLSNNGSADLSENFVLCAYYNLNTNLTSVLVLILTPAACRNGMPSVDYLLSHPFFKTSSSIYNDMENGIHGSIKMSSNIKDQLKKNMEFIENRLKNDQKLYIIEKKQLKIKEILNSEEEMQRRKRKVKSKENDLYRSKSLNGISASNLCSPDKRSESVNSSLSTTSSRHSNSDIKTAVSSVVEDKSVPPSQDRTMLLDSICSFNKGLLNKVKKP